MEGNINNFWGLALNQLENPVYQELAFFFFFFLERLINITIVTDPNLSVSLKYIHTMLIYTLGIGKSLKKTKHYHNYAYYQYRLHISFPLNANIQIYWQLLIKQNSVVPATVHIHKNLECPELFTHHQTIRPHVFHQDKVQHEFSQEILYYYNIKMNRPG